jgi:hypothetical protein
MQPASTMPSMTSAQPTARRRAPARVVQTHLKKKTPFVAETRLAVEGTHTYSTENTVRDTVRDTKPIEKAWECE